MKLGFLLSVVCLGTLFLPVSGFAEEAAQPAAVQSETPKAGGAQEVSEVEVRYREFLASPRAIEEELAKILFKASFQENHSGPYFRYELQNTLADSVLIGAILTVSYVDPDSKKEQTIEVYTDLWGTMPLSLKTGQVEVFRGAEIRKLSPKISLKEIRLRKITP